MPKNPMRIAPPLPAPAKTRPLPREILLINPFYPKDENASFGKHVLTPSLALSSLAAATPAPWRIRVWDENLLQGTAPTAPLPEIVGITVHLTFAKRAYDLAAFYRSQGCMVILGGPHALACPDEVQAHGDAIAIGNGVVLWPRILRDYQAKQLLPRYEAPFTNFAAETTPQRDVIPEWGFLTRSSVIATRGCHNRCDFCYLATGSTRTRYQMRPVPDVVAEIRALRSPYIVFLDNNLGAHKGYLRELCAGLEPLRIIWSAAVSLDLTDDPALVREMARSGCTGVFVGFESLTDDNLIQAGKRSPRAADFARRIALFHAVGIQVNGSFVFGFDNDGPDVFDRVAAFVEKNHLESATFHILTPYPGTPLFSRMEAEGRLLHKDWDRYDTAHAVFRPARMSSETLEDGYRRIYRQMFSLPSIWKRRPAGVASAIAYLAMAILYKRCNWLWRFLIQHRLIRAAWRPLVAVSRLRHLWFRKKLRKPSRVQDLLAAVE